MWIYNTDTEKWERQTDTLSKDNYDSLKVDLEKVKLYSRALSGATYLPIKNIDNIYEPLVYKNTNSWYIDPASSIYNVTTGLPSNGEPINRDTLSIYEDYKYENGFTLKNLFTPEKAIEDINYISVDVATDTEIDVNAIFYTLNGITLIEGQTILVKDQISTVDLAFSVNPDTYFIGNYYLQTDNVSDNTYYFYNSENGIYTFTNNRLVKQTLGTYSLSSNLTILVKLGTYADQQFALSRKLNGYFPIEGEPFEFKSSHNYLLRHQVDYHNLYENNYYDILKHSEQLINVDGFTYTIPERIIYVGDFGVILVNQDFIKSEYVYNVYKYNLKSICEVSKWYWICGEEGTILKMSKIDFSISKIDLGDEFKTLMSISFINDNKGIAVGKYNTIYYTNNGGWDWEKLDFENIQSYSYNKVVYYSETTAYIGGENGVFLRLDYSDVYGWSLNQITISKNLSNIDRYDLIEDINDMYYSSFDSWDLSYNVATYSGISASKDCLFIVSNNSNLIIYDINNFITHDFIYLSFSQSLGDLTSVTRQSGTNNLIISGDNTILFNIEQFNSIGITNNLILGTSYSILYSDYNNKIFDYNGEILFGVGNYGLVSSFSYISSSYSYVESKDTKSKMLFMDYDLADKLNFFDSNYEYRLPNSVTFSSNNGIITSTVSSIEFISNQKTWLSYLVDSYKTYGVNSDTSTGNVILLSTKFYFGLNTLTFSNSDITIDYGNFGGLYPIISSTGSRYTMFTPSAPSNSFKIFIYKYITIIKATYNFCSIGDLILISNSKLDATVMINYLFINGSNYYYYAFNDMNGSMINTLKNNEILTLTNLNKYNSYETLSNNFEKHPISNAYKLSYDSSNIIEIAPRFNNLTAYKSLETDFYISYEDEYINTYVGTAGPGYVNGDSSIAKIYNPVIVTYANNSLYFSEGFDGTTKKLRVRKVDLLTNEVTTVAGLTYSATNGDGGLAINAALNNPLGVALDSNNNIYIAENSGNRIRKIDANTGIISTFCGTGTSGSTGDGGLAINANIDKPFGLAIDSQDNIYFVETGTSKRLRKITTDGKIWTVSQISTSYVLNYITIDKNDNVYLSNGNYIRKYTPLGLTYGITEPFIGNGTIAFSGENVGTFSSINYCGGICFDSKGNLLFGEDSPTPYRRLRKYDVETRLITTVAGGTIYTDDGHSPLQTIIQALGITLDNEDNFYFADFVNSRIRKIKFNFSSKSIYNSDSYNLFGFTPKYSLLNYLSNINSVFTASKVFSSMPRYSLLPCNASGTFTASNIYYDANTGTYSKNKLVFGDNLKFEYDTLVLNTFVDINTYTNIGDYSKNQIMITNKYYDYEIGGWALEFSEKILDIENISLNSIDIFSRNTLQQISDDLDLFNNLNKPLISKKYNNDSYYINFYDNPIKTKINTDSYTKIFLSDGDIKKYITSIIYTDSSNKLSLDVINVPKLVNIDINNSFNYYSNLGLNITNDIDIESSIIAFIKFIGGTGSSQELNHEYFGVHLLDKIDDSNLYANTSYLNLNTVPDIGIINYYKFDPFFNYSPVSLWDIGIDKFYKVPLELFEENLSQSGKIFRLTNIDNNQPIFRLIDGLDINKLSNKYHWIIEAEISDAIIGLDDNGIVWYKGIWHSGRWFNGTWQSGTWISGDWYDGNWYSNEVIDKINYVEVGKYNISSSNSEWYNGRWYNGTWDNGNWYNGRLYGVTWSNGNWYNGIWNDGYWKNGLFSGGIWVNGTWDSGIFNSYNKPSFWINGRFLSGDFQNGMWYNGIFGQNSNTISKFGSKSTNSRNSTWQGGLWSSGNFYSYENIDSTGNTSPSLIQKYSIWKTGKWNQGNFYGGIIYNIEFLNGNFYNGITKDIQIIGIDTSKNEIILNGIFRFNINDYINIINNDNSTPFSSLGNDNAPGRYRVALVRYDLVNNWTTLTLDYNFNLLAFDSPYRKPGGFYVGVNSVDSNGGIIGYSTAVSQNGKNYIIGDTFSVIGGSIEAIGEVLNVDSNGSVLGFNISNPGIGYQTRNIYSTVTAGSVSVSNIDTKLKAVSLFRDVTWYNGVFENGIVENGTFYGCIWYDGIFNGTWGV